MEEVHNDPIEGAYGAADRNPIDLEPFIARPWNGAMRESVSPTPNTGE